MLDFVIVVNDGGELKSLRAADFPDGADTAYFLEDLDRRINAVLDPHAISAGEYNPSENDTPMVFTMGDDE